MNNEYSIETKCIQSGWKPKNGEPRVLPIYQSTTYKYETSDEMGKLFDLEAEGYFYTRLQNPTNDMVAEKICELEGGVAAMLTSSGQAANYYAVFNICEAGDHVVLSSTVYGGTFNLLTVTMKKMGIDCTIVDRMESHSLLITRLPHRSIAGHSNMALTLSHIPRPNIWMDMLCVWVARSLIRVISTGRSTGISFMD